MSPKDCCAYNRCYQNISSNANGALNFDLAPGFCLTPSDLALNTDPMRGYNNELLEAQPSAFGLVAGINRIKKKDVGPVNPDPANKELIKPDTCDKKLDTGDKKPDTKDKKTEIGQEGGNLLTEHQSELNAVLTGASVLVLSGFALRYVMS